VFKINKLIILRVIFWVLFSTLYYNFGIASHGNNSYPAFNGSNSEDITCIDDTYKDCRTSVVTPDNANYQAYRTRLTGDYLDNDTDDADEFGRADLCLSVYLGMGTPGSACDGVTLMYTFGSSIDKEIVINLGSNEDYNFGNSRIEVWDAAFMNGRLEIWGRRVHIDNSNFVSPSSVNLGDTITVSWDTTNSGSNVNLNWNGVSFQGEPSPGSDVVDCCNGNLSGSRTFRATSTGTANFELEANGPGHDGLTNVIENDSVTVRTPCTGTGCDIWNAFGSSCTAPCNAHINWRTTNVSQCEIRRGSTLLWTSPCGNGDRFDNGLSAGTYRYSLREGFTDQELDSYTLTVNNPVNPPETDIRCEGSGGTCNIFTGESVDIEWCGSDGGRHSCANSSGGCSVSNNRDSTTWSGSDQIRTVSPTLDTIYTLTCTNSDGVLLSDSVTVDVTAPPAAEAIIRAVNVSTGGRDSGSPSTLRIASGTDVSIEWCDAGSSGHPCANSANGCQVTNTANSTVWTGLQGSERTGPISGAVGTTRTYTLRCTNSADVDTTDSVTVEIDTPPPVCNGSPDPGLVSESITFTPMGGNGSFTWSAPGGTPSSRGTPSGSNFSTTYSTSGTKTVTVTSGGLSDTCTVTIDPFRLSLSASDPSGPVPHDTSLTATVTGGSGNYDYYFYWNTSCTGTAPGTCHPPLTAPAAGSCVSDAEGDGYRCSAVSTSNRTTPLHTYPTSGSKRAKVIVRDIGRAVNRADTRTISVGAATSPTVDIRCNDTATSCSITSGSSATIDWCGASGSVCANADTCIVTFPTGSWPGTSGTKITDPLFVNTTYDLSCTGPGGTTNDSVLVDVGVVTPTADIRCNDTATSCSITSGSSATIDWCGASGSPCANADTCTVTFPTGSWIGTSGTQTVTPTSMTTYNLSCTNTASATTINDEVTVNVSAPAGFACSVTATPSSGTSPLNNVDLLLEIVSGDRGRQKYYYYDCNSADGVSYIRSTGFTPVTSYSFNDICSYSTNGTHTVSAKVQELGAGAQPDALCTTTVEVEPTLTLSFTATLNPSAGTVPNNVNLRAVVGGNAIGTANYSLWWNCPNSSNDVSVVSADPACGALSSPGPGNCATNAVGYKCEGVNDIPLFPFASVIHQYSLGGNYRAKAIIERSNAVPAEGSADIVLANPVPTASNTTVSVSNGSYCSSGVHATVSWNYFDPSGAIQRAYQVQINDSWDGSFQPLGTSEWDSGVILGPGNANSTLPCSPTGSCTMTWNTNYRAWVKVQNSYLEWSPWTLMNTYINSGVCSGVQCVPSGAPVTSWTTPSHSFPNPDFSSSPPAPAVDSPVTFIELAGTFSPDSIIANWSWNFGDGTAIVNQSDPTPPLGPTSTTHVYSNTGNYPVVFTTQDEVGVCSVTHQVILQGAIPQWREVAPR